MYSNIDTELAAFSGAAPGRDRLRQKTLRYVRTSNRCRVAIKGDGLFLWTVSTSCPLDSATLLLIRPDFIRSRRSAGLRSMLCLN
jgi:hypothetical protein